MLPVGLVSLANLLHSEGIDARVVNLGSLMIEDPGLDAERYIHDLEADVYGISLHWIVHAHGALETARLLKKHHPDARIVMGGISASEFWENVLDEHPYVDAVVVGPAEAAMVQLARGRPLAKVPGIAHRKDGRLVRNESAKPPKDIDDLDYATLDLVEGRGFLDFDPEIGLKYWCIPTMRGCVYRCSTCGGSYEPFCRQFSVQRPLLRSPERIVDDLSRLADTDINGVFLFHDVRMGGKKYWKRLAELIRKERPELDRITMEIFSPASREFLLTWSKLQRVGFTISPETADEDVRRAQGRRYSNSALEATLRTCESLHIYTGVYYTVGLGRQTRTTLASTWSSWERLIGLNRGDRMYVKPDFGVQLIVDPGSPAFLDPSTYGYTLTAHTLEDHRTLLLDPSWKSWFGYRTDHFDSEDLAELALASERRMTIAYRNAGVFSEWDAEERLQRTEDESLLLVELDRIAERPEGDQDHLLHALVDEVGGHDLSGVTDAWRRRMRMGRFGRRLARAMGFK
jgi:B12-binding domain/radical SAM domain protein